MEQKNFSLGHYCMYCRFNPLTYFDNPCTECVIECYVGGTKQRFPEGFNQGSLQGEKFF